MTDYSTNMQQPASERQSRETAPQEQNGVIVRQAAAERAPLYEQKPQQFSLHSSSANMSGGQKQHG